MNVLLLVKMNINIVYILVIVFISGVIGLSNRKLSVDDSGTIINGKNASDIPAVTTLSPTASPPPTTITPPEPTTPPTTTSSKTTTSTTEIPKTTTVPSTPEPTTTSTTSAPPTPEPITTSTTSAPPTNATSTTESTTTTTTAAPAHKGRHFDGPSFIGGIILASGLMAIGFVSWKFYKARTELRSQGHTK